MSQSIHLKYRPSSWDEVVGHRSIVKSVCRALTDGSAHSFLLTGPSGVGKTTIARIIAREVGCDPVNLKEIDAATYTGIDAMRAITECLHYNALGSSPTKVLIVDEAHALSKAAWQSLLKGVEEPPEHVYWIFCTTEAAKVPETIKTRCLVYDLPPLHHDDLMDLAELVVKAEKSDLDDRSLSILVKAAQGSPRRLLTAMAQCLGAKDHREVLELLKTIDYDEGEAIDLARAIVAGITWEKAMTHVKALEDVNPESVRIVINRYLAGCLKSAKGDQRVTALLNMLQAFDSPYNQSEGQAPLLLSLGRVVYG